MGVVHQDKWQPRIIDEKKTFKILSWIHEYSTCILMKDLISVDTFRDNKLFQNDFGDFDSVW